MPSKPTVRVRPRSYQPTRAEINEEFKIDATPDQLAKAMLRDVEIEHVPPAKRARKR